MPNFASLAATECHVPEDWVANVVRQGPRRAKILRIKKKNSDKFRSIARPSAELEMLQRWLLLKFFNQLELHDSAMAFRDGHSILTNAVRHKGSAYFIRIDFKDFFSSIKLQDFIMAMSQTKFFGFHLTEYSDYMEFIGKICFDSRGRLPIGYVTSPIISNAVMYRFDVALSNAISARTKEFGVSVLTRYADDIVFSTDLKGGCAAFLKFFQEFVSAWASPSLVINTEKTIFSSKAGGSAMVTGLRICNDNHITVTREYKDKIRLMLSLYQKSKLNEDELPALRGHLSYVKHVSPAFFSAICSKYLTAIEKLI
ncbi:retron St85 family RNA-directed DNA polymerase [Burkholderia gladioli]|uniref:retron St85 family RNA-directed DNA polymerase n=1 Tax=Burkholderia gladioli TaxID=28095 RepID=UPI000D00849B|nr:retron St85 family RNA-directed DNA polymerase [Burkholderia gladioli]PRE80881.1 RNA-directed DNA polymerase [Burkholderia gladioli]